VVVEKAEGETEGAPNEVAERRCDAISRGKRVMYMRLEMKRLLKID